MTRVRLEQLPTRAREQALNNLNKPARKRQTQRVGPHDGTGRWRCVACDDLCTTWAAVERHRDQHAHHRFEQVMP